MRSKKALLGTITSLSYEVVAMICGLILPRLILEQFGSAYNGLTSSIAQFLSCISLLKAGIGGVTKAALYQPLVNNDKEKISAIINATQMFIRRISYIFLAFLLILSAAYPLIVRDFDWGFSASLVLILGIGTFFQYYFGITYGMLLEADQRTYIYYTIQIISTVLNTVVAVILLKMGNGIHVVKLGSSIVFTLHSFLVWLYAKMHYRLDKKIKADMNLIKHRWDAFAQEVAFFVHNNTDIIVLTVMSTMREISVYTVYNYVIMNLRRVIVSIVDSFASAFGDMLARNEIDIAKENLSVYEIIVFTFTTIMYSVAAVMILPFVVLYTKNVTDANYIRPVFSVLIILAAAFSCYRIPYKTIVDAVGHFKQMRNGAIIEAAINVVISVAAVKSFGLVGIAVGTLAATIFRSIQYATYLQKNILVRKQGIFFGRVLLSVGTILAVMGIAYLHPTDAAPTVTGWIIRAVIVTVCVTVFSLGTNLLFYRKDCLLTYRKIIGMLERRKKHKDEKVSDLHV